MSTPPDHGKPHNLIDVHHHALPSEYVAELRSRGMTGEGGLTPFPDWNADDDLAMMDRQGIAAAVLSIAAPGVYFDDIGVVRRLARLCNETLAETVRNHPTRYTALAVLPLPDVDAGLAELAYALDVLKFEGVALLTSIGTHYLGDARYAPLMDELDRRRAVVFVHPREPESSRQSGLTLPPTTVEYVFDTTRAVANLMFSGALERWPNVSYILSHAGGAVPFLAWRLAIGLHATQLPLREKLYHAVEHLTHLYDRDVLDEGRRGIELLQKHFYYDTALSATPFAMPSLQSLVGPDRILFGSDWPYGPEFIVAETVHGLKTHGQFDDAGLQAVARGNALHLFPQLAARIGAAATNS